MKARDGSGKRHQFPKACAVSSGPFSQRMCGAADGGDPLRRRDRLIGADAALDEHLERLAGELIDDVAASASRRRRSVKLEVQRPHVIGALRREAAGQDRRVPPAGRRSRRTRNAYIVPPRAHSRCTRLR